MSLGSIPPPSRIMHKCQAPTQCKIVLNDFGGGFEVVLDDGDLWARFFIGSHLC